MSAPAEQRGGFGRGAARGGDRGRGGAYRMRLEEGRNGTGEQVYRSRQQRRRTGPNTSWIRINRKDGMLDMRERSISQHGRRRIRWRPRRGENRQGRRFTCCAACGHVAVRENSVETIHQKRPASSRPRQHLHDILQPAHLRPLPRLKTCPNRFYGESRKYES